LATKALDYLLLGLSIVEVRWVALRTEIVEANDGTEG
jgi:hypothetical protein